MIQPRGRSDISKTFSLVALNVVLFLTAGYSHAQDDEFNKALKGQSGSTLGL